MKKIEAIIRKTKFEDVKDALLEADIEWFSYYDVRGIGKSRQARIYRGVMYDTSSIERILISIVVRDKNAEKTVQAIIRSAQTGEIGDGRIFIMDSLRLTEERAYLHHPHRRRYPHPHRRTWRHRPLQCRTGKIIQAALNHGESDTLDSERAIHSK